MDALFNPGFFRLLLAMLVVVQHVGLIDAGISAVNIFFILSGYWIARMWQEQYRHARKNYLTFVVSRFWRVAPIYACCVILFGLLLYILPGQRGGMKEYVNAEWLVRTFALVGSTEVYHWLPQSWSLDVEMQFYLFAPLLTAGGICLTKKPHSIRVAGLVLVALVALGLLVFAPSTLFLRHLLFFFAGMFVYLFAWKPSQRLAVISLGALVAFAIGMTWWSFSERDHFDPQVEKRIKYGLETVTGLVALPAAAFTVWCRTGAWDRHLGNISYPVYLFHTIPVLIIKYVYRQPIETLPWPVFLALDWGLVVVGSLALYLLVDQPMEKLRRYFVHSHMPKRAKEIETGVIPSLPTVP